MESVKAERDRFIIVTDDKCNKQGLLFHESFFRCVRIALIDIARPSSATRPNRILAKTTCVAGEKIDQLDEKCSALPNSAIQAKMVVNDMTVTPAVI